VILDGEFGHEQFPGVFFDELMIFMMMPIYKGANSVALGIHLKWEERI